MRERSKRGDRVLFSSVGLWEWFLGVKITRIPYHSLPLVLFVAVNSNIYAPMPCYSYRYFDHVCVCVCVCNVRSGQSLVEDVVDKSTIAALPLAGEAPDFPCVPTDDTCGELMGK